MDAYCVISATGQTISTAQTAFHHCTYITAHFKSSLHISSHHCTFQVITAHFVHHCTLKQALLFALIGSYKTLQTERHSPADVFCYYPQVARSRRSKSMSLYIILLVSVCVSDYSLEPFVHYRLTHPSVYPKDLKLPCWLTRGSRTIA